MTVIFHVTPLADTSLPASIALMRHDAPCLMMMLLRGAYAGLKYAICHARDAR